MNYEKKLDRLEEIVHKMESGELSLEDSLKLFEEGIKLSRDCTSKLNEAEQQVKLLLGMDENGKPLTTDFAADDPS